MSSAAERWIGQRATLNEQTFMERGENANYGAMFAQQNHVDCP